jgi:methylenetetrahydrofolate reductase (NADPH)
MAQESRAVLAEHALEDLKSRIVHFVRSASTEITPGDERRLPELSSYLPTGAAVYVAHTPKALLSDVVYTALAVQRAGFLATPHIVARRIANALTLRRALAQLRAGGVQQILLVAGDTPQPTGEFLTTLDVLECGALQEAGISRIGVAGHPEGHKAVGPLLLWKALQAKQVFAARTGTQMHIVTQFSFNADALSDWGFQLPRHEIHLPVHVGIAGPAPLPKLIHFAMQCGIGVSLRTVMHNLSAVGSIAELAISPDQHLLRLMSMAAPAGVQIVAPHFFGFGGCLETARWIRQVAAGQFQIDQKAGKFRMEG